MAPELMSEIEDEVLLLIPADDPATLVRASLACKCRRRCILDDPIFRRRRPRSTARRPRSSASPATLSWSAISSRPPPCAAHHASGPPPQRAPAAAGRAEPPRCRRRRLGPRRRRAEGAPQAAAQRARRQPELERGSALRTRRQRPPPRLQPSCWWAQMPRRFIEIKALLPSRARLALLMGFWAVSRRRTRKLVCMAFVQHRKDQNSVHQEDDKLKAIDADPRNTSTPEVLRRPSTSDGQSMGFTV